MAGKTRVLRFTEDNTVAGAFSFTIPGGCARFRVRMLGGGGGGGGGGRANTNGGNGGGGGGGARAIVFDVSTYPGASWTGLLGAGGTGGTGQGPAGNNPLPTDGGAGQPTMLTDGIQNFIAVGAQGGQLGWSPGDNRPSLGGMPTVGGGSATHANPEAIYPPIPGQGGSTYMASNSAVFTGYNKPPNTPQSGPGQAPTGSDFSTTQGKGGGAGGASEWPYGTAGTIWTQTGGNPGNYLTTNGNGNNGSPGVYGGGGGGGGGGRNSGGTNSGGQGGAGGMGCCEIILEY